MSVERVWIDRIEEAKRDSRWYNFFVRSLADGTTRISAPLRFLEPEYISWLVRACKTAQDVDEGSDAAGFLLYDRLTTAPELQCMKDVPLLTTQRLVEMTLCIDAMQDVVDAIVHFKLRFNESTMRIICMTIMHCDDPAMVSCCMKLTSLIEPAFSHSICKSLGQNTRRVGRLQEDHEPAFVDMLRVFITNGTPGVEDVINVARDVLDLELLFYLHRGITVDGDLIRAIVHLLKTATKPTRHTISVCKALPSFIMLRVLTPDGDLEEALAVYAANTGDTSSFVSFPATDGVDIKKRAQQAIADYDISCQDVSTRADLVRLCRAPVFNVQGRKAAVCRAMSKLTDDYGECPITLMPIVIPVKDQVGVVFERDALLKWLYHDGRHPLTRQALCLCDLDLNVDGLDCTF